MLDYLRQLAQQDQLPAPVTGEADIDMLRVLRAAGMVQAEIPGVDKPGRTARLIAVTGLGRATLRAETAREFIARRKQLPDIRSMGGTV
ncbi:hypothetical protein [Diaphorobacter sp.]|uniref:hypothetical protein n=1 Tax=Diaphorobacter sp. TaxID=1934310 RepID=UPI003D0CA27D